MNKNFIGIFLILSLLSLKLNAQIEITDFEDASIYFDGLFRETSKLDDYGNVIIDMGSASAGRVAFRITDVDIEMEEREEEPGCADICPPRILITFKCRKSECVYDPIMSDSKYNTGVIEFQNLKRGRKAFRYLKELKRFIQNN